MTNFYKKESHYLWTLVVLVCAYVLYINYFFPRSWADIPAALAFIDAVGSVVPVLKHIQLHVRDYSNYWGVFYAVFWVMAPLYWVLGLVGSFYLSAQRYERLVVQTSALRIWSIFFLASISVMWQLALPMLSFGIFVNQMSNFLPKLLISWFVTAGCFYCHGQVIGVLILKSKFSAAQQRS